MAEQWVSGRPPKSTYDVNIVGGNTAGTEFTDGDAIDTNSKGTLLIGTTDVSGTARTVITDNDGHLQVDVLSGANGGTQYAVDTAAGGTDTGTLALVVRDDTLTTLTPADGDYVQLRTNSTGALWVKPDGDVTIADGGNSITVDGTVTETNSAAILADTANIDTNVGTIAGAVSGTEMQVDVVTSALPTGAATAANQLPDGHNVTVDNAAGASAVNIQDGGNSITVDGTVTANLSATDNAVLDNIDSNTDSGAVVGGGTEATAQRVTIANDSTGVLSVDDNGGSLTVDGTVTANLSATDNAVLDQIEVNTSYGDNTGGGTEAGALRVTVANNSTGVLSVDDNGGSLTVDGAVTAQITAYESIGDGRKVVTSAGTAEALAASTAIQEVTITAEEDNTGTIVVGGSTVVASLSTRRGTPLFPTGSITLKIDNLAAVFIDSTVSGDGVTYTYVV